MTERVEASPPEELEETVVERMKAQRPS